jgi:hypothetical protein
MSTSTSTMKSRKAEAPTPAQEAPEDPRDVALAELRQKVEAQEAAIGRLQELMADAVVWAGCPCGHERSGFRLQNAVIINGRLWHDQGHHSFYGAKVEAAE